jgi:hypothetical protein
MIKSALFAVIGLVFVSTEAMATCSSYPYSLTNGTTANADQVMANFNCAALTDGNFSGPVNSAGGLATAGSLSTGGTSFVANRDELYHSVTTDMGNGIVDIRGGGGNVTAQFTSVSGAGFNNANTAIFVAKDTSTGRSINAGGTINASGADYAEWERVASGFTAGDFSKGSVVGFDTSGKVTGDCQSAVSFAVISTAPSFVGGDAWGTDLPKGADRKAWLDKEQSAQVQVAYSGKVPVNFRDAHPGQYLSVFCQGKQFSLRAQTQQDDNTIGRVRSILPDGRVQIAITQ